VAGFAIAIINSGNRFDSALSLALSLLPAGFWLFLVHFHPYLIQILQSHLLAQVTVKEQRS